MTRLYIVASCTNRKRLPVSPELQLRSVAEKDVTARAQKWLRRLEHSAGETVAAGALYAGDHWGVVRTLPECARRAGFTPELWVMSAGYGLVADTAPLHPYSATFAVAQPDSVDRRKARVSDESVAQAWWACLTEWPGPQPGAPRSLQALARRDPRAAMLVLGSPEYVAAVEKDVEEAAEVLEDPTRLIVVSSGGFPGTRLATHVIISDARLQPTLGGARVSLNARVARTVLGIARGRAWNVSRLRVAYQAKLTRMAEVRVNERQRMTDQEVREFIIENLAKQPRASATGLLRELRESGRACEQNRFKTLFLEARQGRHGA